MNKENVCTVNKSTGGQVHRCHDFSVSVIVNFHDDFFSFFIESCVAVNWVFEGIIRGKYTGVGRNETTIQERKIRWSEFLISFLLKTV